ncbi:MAG TPA: carbon-nitrogen hydrolase family protein [Anaerolineae bacterium]|nr:carbon-nitrogen hydrolase family protein [Anaerolineae bacterium]HIQ04735.1 carbon-nitrogen hydrolase family protein [Anaerolineae bacterium]
MREITVAVVQMQPVLAEPEENLQQMSEYVRHVCTEQPVDLIVFPELATTGYECGLRFTQMAERVPDHAVNLLAKDAAQFNTYIAFGMPTKEKVESVIYNAAVLIGPEGEVVGEYRKLHLKGEERLAFRAGYRIPTFETTWGQLGLLLGWDLAFPEAARSLALDGAELIAVCANWERPHHDAWRAYCLTRAGENAVFLAAANRVGEEPSYAFFGDSMVIGPGGELLASLEEPVAGYTIAIIDLDEVRRQREELQLMQVRQPQAYRAIVRKY